MLASLTENLHLIQYAHLLWGFALFCALLLWIYRPSGRKQMLEHARNILDEERHVGK